MGNIFGSDKVKVVFVIGGPGSGKGTQCKKIKEAFDFEHKSTGDILRAIVSKKEHPKWQELDEKMRNGAFVSTAELLEFIKEEFKSLAGKKVLLDGFPRNQENIDEWNKSMSDVAEIAGVLYFECEEEEMKKRMLGRNEGRTDDNEETMIKRIENFIQFSKPIADQYEKEGKIMKFNAMRSVDEIFNDVKAKLIEKNFKLR